MEFQVPKRIERYTGREVVKILIIVCVCLCLALILIFDIVDILQVINGLMERDDWQEAIKIPLTALPGGSGNALAVSLNYYAGFVTLSPIKM